MPLSHFNRVIELHERESRVFPRSDLFDGEGKSLVLSETRRLSAVDLREVIGGVELRVLGLIGFLPLTADIALNLRPKFPFGNLWSMLEASDEKYERIFPVLRSYETTSGSAPHLMLARCFAYYLRQILSTGVSRGYFAEEHRGLYRPKLNFGRTVASYLARGDSVNVAADSHSFSAALYINGIIASACRAFLRLVPRDARWADERGLFIEALAVLSRIPHQTMRPGDESLSSALPIWARHSYFGALSAYSLLKGFSTIGFSYDSVGSQMPSFLFSLDHIFESYVRNTIRAGLKTELIAVLDGNSPKHQRPLFLDNRQYPIKPDMIFRKDGKILGLGEIKYKPRLDEADRYQLLSHVVATSAPLGVWVSPAADLPSSYEYVGRLSGGAQFYHFRLNISGKLSEDSAHMVREVSRLLKAR